MTKALTVFKKINFSEIFPLNALGSKFDIDPRQVKVNIGSPFEQTW